jgi:predicted SprT family Zn-dependent metalloprotease
MGQNNNNSNKAVTRAEYEGFQRAYDYFNRELFEGGLPSLLITLRARARSRGYFSPGRFTSRNEDATVHEVALNPDTFSERTDEDILSTLVHEQVHAWQETFGKPSRGRYHNKEWAHKMAQLGLGPSDTGQPGGKRTGQRVSHYIIEGGPFSAAYRKLAATGFKLHWNSRADQAKTKNSKTKFTCGTCGQNAWAKADAELVCGRCEQIMLAPSESKAPASANRNTGRRHYHPRAEHTLETKRKW